MKHNKNEYTLDMISPGESVTVTGTFAESSMRRRLRDVGFCDEENIQCIMRSPLGDPSAYLVRGTIIALRKEDSGLITVSR